MDAWTVGAVMLLGAVAAIAAYVIAGFVWRLWTDNDEPDYGDE